jgi:hypothetical protein
MINSYKKGRSFEQQIAKLLTTTSNKPWKRVPNSGSLKKLHTHPLFQGDIYSENYPDVHVECKAFRMFHTAQLFNAQSNFNTSIKQVIKESNGRDWLLFIKPNNKGLYVLFNRPGVVHDLGLVFKKTSVCIMNKDCSDVKYHLLKIDTSHIKNKKIK